MLGLCRLDQKQGGVNSGDHKEDDNKMGWAEVPGTQLASGVDQGSRS